MANGKPTRGERAAEEETRWRFYRTIPRRHWEAMSGRQRAQLDHQARTYGAPIGENVIDLEAFVRWFHEFIAENGRKLLRVESADDPLTDGSDPESPALERLREEQWKLKRLERLEREGRLVDREEQHHLLARIAANLRNCGEQLQRQYGEGALEILTDAIDDCQKLIDKAEPAEAA